MPTPEDQAPAPPKPWWIPLALVGLALALARTLPDLVPLHLAAIGAHWLICALALGRALAGRWRRGPMARALAAALLLALLHGPAGLAVALSAAFGDVLVSVDLRGDATGPEYPRGPKALFRTRGDPGTREMYFRPILLGFLLGPGRTPYQG